MLTDITPLILTYNEAPNIRRTLEQLRWALDIVIVDSFSDDDTLEIVSTFPNVRVVQRKFDNHEGQWNFGRRETAISTEWILALDADYVLSSELVDELESLQPAAEINGYRVGFTYCVNGQPLRSGVYPPVTVLYRRWRGDYAQDGHTHRLIIDDPVASLRSRILHDDRKPLSRWFASQLRYMTLEAQKVLASDPATRSTADKIRRLRVIAPIAVGFYCLIVRGGLLDGWPGLYYAFQRTVAELILSLNLIEADLRCVALERTQRKNAAEEKTEAVIGNSR